MNNIEFIKNLTLNQIFNIFKDNTLTAKLWSEILKYREGTLNFNSLYLIIKKSIEHYDKSIYVNSFYYNNKLYWLDKNTRLGLFRLIDSGAKLITLLLGDEYLNIEVSLLKNFLNLLEVYAGECFSATAKHISELKLILKLEDLINYDYTTGYPDKITLNEN